MRYRPEIDGLRAIAVLPVILFHAGFSSFAGGFIGVDVFFVISGYLITAIVIDEQERGVFSLWKFYDRRARRILPALIVAIAISAPIAFLLMLPDQLKDFGQSIIASFAFIANFFFWIKSDYWGHSADFTALIHLWSLGVEEQFYLATPLVALISKNRFLLVGFFLLLTATSFAAMVYMYGVGRESGAFYLLPFRAWEISAGAIAALIQQKIPSQRERDDIISALALFVLAVAVALLDNRTHPAILSGLPVVVAFSLVLFCRDGITAKLLTARPLVWTGLISYSLYLFHQPVLVFLRFLSLEPIDALTAFTGIGISFALAFATYRIAESPCRKRQVVGGKAFYLGTLTALVTLVAWGGLLAMTSGLAEVKLAMMDDVTRASVEKLSFERSAREALWEVDLRGSEVPFSNDESTKVIFAGDSLSGDLYVAATQTPMPGFEFRRILLDDVCIRTNGKSGKGYGSATCREELDHFHTSPLVEQADWLVIANGWLGGSGTLRNLLDFPSIQGKNLIIYKPPAFLNMRSVVLAVNKFGTTPNSADLQKFIFANRHQRTLNSNRILQEIAETNGLATISGYDFFCDKILHTCQLFSANGSPRLIDQGHLSASGVKEFANWFAHELSAKIKATR